MTSVFTFTRSLLVSEAPNPAKQKIARFQPAPTAPPRGASILSLLRPIVRFTHTWFSFRYPIAVSFNSRGRPFHYTLPPSSSIQTLPTAMNPKIDYETSEKWADVVPIPQNEGGPQPLAAIFYPDDYRQAMEYLRAVMAANEASERVLELTEHIISINPAHYTVWCAFPSLSLTSMRSFPLIRIL